MKLKPLRKDLLDYIPPALVFRNSNVSEFWSRLHRAGKDKSYSAVAGWSLPPLLRQGGQHQRRQK